jgi:hypothetical protein
MVHLAYNGAMPDALPTEVEVAAALAAIDRYVAEIDVAPHVEPNGWHESAKLTVQHLRPARTAIRLSWGNVERVIRQTGGGFFGVTGL